MIAPLLALPATSLPAQSLPCTLKSARQCAWGADEASALWRFRHMSGYEAYNALPHPSGDGYIAYGRRTCFEDGNDG